MNKSGKCLIPYINPFRNRYISDWNQSIETASCESVCSCEEGDDIALTQSLDSGHSSQPDVAKSRELLSLSLCGFECCLSGLFDSQSSVWLVKSNSVDDKSVDFAGSIDELSYGFSVSWEVPDLYRQSLTGSLADEDVFVVSVLIGLWESEGGSRVVLFGDSLPFDEADELVDLLVEGLQSSGGSFLLGRGADFDGGVVGFDFDLSVAWNFDSVLITAILPKSAWYK